MRLMTMAASAALLAGLAAAPLVHAQTAPPATTATAASEADPFAWLEDIENPKALAWVEKQNARTAARLEGDPRYETFRKEALAIFTAKDRIPKPDFRAGGIDNFWQDDAHPKGLWRHASLQSYRTAVPQWET